MLAEFCLDGGGKLTWDRSIDFFSKQKFQKEKKNEEDKKSVCVLCYRNARSVQSSQAEGSVFTAE